MNVECVLDSLDLDWMHALLFEHYHSEGPGRNPFHPSAMFKAQILKYLLQIPSDRRLALRLRRDRRLSKACGFHSHRIPSHGLFTQFRLRLGEEAYQRIFSRLARTLIESGTLIGKVVAVDSTHIEAYSGRALDNVSGRSDQDARVGRGRRGFVLGYRVHTVCCADSELPIAYTVAPCNETISSTSSLRWRRPAGSASVPRSWWRTASTTARTSGNLRSGWGRSDHTGEEGLPCEEGAQGGP